MDAKAAGSKLGRRLHGAMCFWGEVRSKCAGGWREVARATAGNAAAPAFSMCSGGVDLWPSSSSASLSID